MTIQITSPEVEALINQRLQSGEFKDAEDVILQALQSASAHAQERAFDKRRAQEAARRIRELRKGVTLGGLTIRQLIDEGRR